ncbi:MAG: hypothetical protein ACXWL5_05230, partial [Candidatus Chromulinivorax sp.]
IHNNVYPSIPSKLLAVTVIASSVAWAMDNLKTDVSVIDYPRNRVVSDKVLDKKSFINQIRQGKIDYPIIRVSELDLVAPGLLFDKRKERVKLLFEKAKMNAPCFVMAEETELSSIVLSVAFGPNLRQAVIDNCLLEEIQKVENLNLSIIIDTKFLPDINWRNDEESYYDLSRKLNKNEIFQYLDKSCKYMNISSGLDNSTIAALVNAQQGAIKNDDCTLIELINFLRYAQDFAEQDKACKIELKHFYKASRCIGNSCFAQFSIQLANCPLWHNQKNIAYHEAGHALLALHKDVGRSLLCAAVIPCRDFYGEVQFIESYDASQTKIQMYHDIMMNLAGAVTEQELGISSYKKFEDINEGFIDLLSRHRLDDGDFYLARYKARKLIDTIDSLTEDEMQQEINVILKKAYVETQQYIRSNKEKVIALGDLLLEKEILSGKELRNWFKEYSLSKD